MQNNQNRSKVNNSSLFQFIKSLFQGTPAEVHYHYAPTVNTTTTTTTHKVVRMSDLSAESKQSFDALFDSLFSNVQTSKF